MLIVFFQRHTHTLGRRKIKILFFIGLTPDPFFFSDDDEDLLEEDLTDCANADDNEGGNSDDSNEGNLMIDDTRCRCYKTFAFA